MKQENKLLPGSLFCLLTGAAAWVMANYIPTVGKLIGGPVFAILLGMILAFWKRPSAMDAGITFCSKKILQYSIIFIGFGMNIRTVLATGGQSLAVMLCTIAASLLTAFLMGRALKVPGNTATLIGVGTSICGGSAIAATAPVIEADDREVAYSISTIFLFNILAVFIFPALGRVFHMTDTGFGIWAGTAINDTSSVVAAGFTFSDAAGELATIVKLTRTLMIIPITLALTVHRTWKRKQQGTAAASNYSIVKIFPWFVLGFLLTAILNSTGWIPSAASSWLNELGKFGIMVAMAGIGLNTNLKNLVKNGVRPIALGLCCWFVVAVVSLVVQHLLHLV